MIAGPSMTVFEGMFEGLVGATVVWSDSLCGAVLEGTPQAPLHAIVFPRNRIERLAYAAESHTLLLGHLIFVAKEIAVKYAGQEAGFRLVINDGSSAHQTVPHLCVHVLAGRPFSWPPG